MISLVLTLVGRLPDLRGRERDPAARLPAADPSAERPPERPSARPRRAAAAGRVRDRGGADRRANRACSSGREARRPPRPRAPARATATPRCATARSTRSSLPATHNAMSVPLPGWYSSEQERPIADQLADGVRGLLIDTHYADRLAERQAAHGLRSARTCARSVSQDGVSAEAVGGRDAHPQQARLLRRGRERDVPLPHVLRAGRHPARVDTRRHPRLPRVAPRRGRRDRQPGLPDPRGLRGGRERRGARGPRLHPARERALGDACAR